MARSMAVADAEVHAALETVRGIGTEAEARPAGDDGGSKESGFQKQVAGIERDCTLAAHDAG